jgi:hypothetical protein
MVLGASGRFGRGNEDFAALESCLWRRLPAYFPIRSFQGLHGAEQIPVGQVIRVMEEERS